MSAGPITEGEDLDLQEAVLLVLRNWWQELASLANEQLTALGEWPRARIMLHINAGTIDVCRIRGHATEKFAMLTSGPAQATAKELSRAVRGAELGTDVFLTLPADQVLRPRLMMPKARRASLQGALRYEVERINPIGPDDLYYDFVVGSSGGDTVEIELRMVRKAAFEEVLGLCRTVGLAVAGIYFEGDQRAGDWRTFPVDRSAFLRTLFNSFGLAILSGLAVMLLVLVLVGAYLREAATLDALSDAVADAGVRAARVEQMNETIDRTSKDLGLAARQKEAPFFVSILAELTQTLPDGTWITELTIDGAKLRIQGASSQASDLIGLIDRSSRFSNARFEAPVVHDTAAKVDRFDLSFDVRGVSP